MLSMDDGSLDVVQISEVLESTLQQPGFLAELTDGRLIVVVEHAISEDGVGHLRCRKQVHLEQSSLEVSIFGSVSLEDFEKEGCALLDCLHLHKAVNDLNRRYYAAVARMRNLIDVG